MIIAGKFCRNLYLIIVYFRLGLFVEINCRTFEKRLDEND